MIGPSCESAKRITQAAACSEKWVVGGTDRYLVAHTLSEPILLDDGSVLTILARRAAISAHAQTMSCISRNGSRVNHAPLSAASLGGKQKDRK